MEIKIYEDQDGRTIYTKENIDTKEKDEEILKLFQNGVELYIEKTDKIEIICFMRARLGLDRKIGLYSRLKSDNINSIFNLFKKETEKTLKELNFELNINDKDNIIFNNIERLDNKTDKILGNILLEAINKEHLEYNSGIDSAIEFIQKLLERNIKIIISRKNCKIGQINILLDKDNSKSPLVSSKKTKEILDNYNSISIEKKKKEEKDAGIKKIKSPLIEVIYSMSNVGYSNSEIKKELDIIITEILGNTKPIVISTNISAEKDDNKHNIFIKPIYIIIIVIAIIMIVLSWYFYIRYLPLGQIYHNITNRIFR